MQQVKKQLQDAIAELKSGWGINEVKREDLAAVLEKVVAAVDRAAQLPEAKSLPNYYGYVMKGKTIYTESISFSPEYERAPEDAVAAVVAYRGGSDKYCIGLYDYRTGIFYLLDHNGNQFFMTNNALILHTGKEVYFLKEDTSTPNSYYLYDLSGNKVSIDQSNADIVLRQA